VSRVVVGLLLTAFLLGASGCINEPSGILTLTGPDLRVEDCTSVQDIPVATLGWDVDLCRPAGSTLVFPLGKRLEVDPLAASSSSSSAGVTNTWVDVCSSGLVAGRYAGGCTAPQVWGDRQAVAKVRDAFGAEWSCDRLDCSR